MKKSTPHPLRVLTLAATLVIAACAGNATRDGALALVSAPAVKAAIELCVAEDAEARAALAEPARFFVRGYEFIVARDRDTSVAMMEARLPRYLDAVPGQWAAIWSALDDRDCGPLVTGWRTRSEAAWGALTAPAEASERYQRACALYNVFAPMAALYDPRLAIGPADRLPFCAPAPVVHRGIPDER